MGKWKNFKSKISRGGITSQSNKKTKILLKLLAPCSVALIAGSACGCLLTSCSKTLEFTSVNDVDNYLNKHKKIHEDAKDWSTKDENDKEMLEWLWNRKNFGLQNMINGILGWDYKNILENAQDLGSKDIELTLKVSNKSCEFHQKLNLTDNDDTMSFAGWVKIKNFKNDGFDLEAENKINDGVVNSISAHIISWTRIDSYLPGAIGLHCADNNDGGAESQFALSLLKKEYPNIAWPIN